MRINFLDDLFQILRQQLDLRVNRTGQTVGSLAFIVDVMVLRAGLVLDDGLFERGQDGFKLGLLRIDPIQLLVKFVLFDLDSFELRA